MKMRDPPAVASVSAIRRFPLFAHRFARVPSPGAVHFIIASSRIWRHDTDGTDARVYWTANQYLVAASKFMRWRVYPLRRRGRRLPWREVANGPSFEGDLSTYCLSLPSGRYFVATLVAPGDALCKPLLPEL